MTKNEIINFLNDNDICSLCVWCDKKVNEEPCNKCLITQTCANKRLFAQKGNSLMFQFVGLTAE